MKLYLHNSLRALFLSLAVLLSLPMLAERVEINGINYDLVAEINEATVIAKRSGRYSGEIVIPESVEHEGTTYSVTSIGEYAFYWCSSMTSVTIPNSVASIGEGAFSVCSGLTSVHISDIAAWCNIEFANFRANPLSYAQHLYLNGEEVKDLVIPNDVTSIGDYAFEGCSGLTSVTIPNSVTSIGEEAFYGCSGLTSVTIPNSVTSIGNLAFSVCSGLTSVTIGSGVKIIGLKSFANCPKLLDVYCYAENVPSTESDAFDGSYPEYATLHVPDGSIDSYKAKTPWSGFGKIMGLSGGEPEQPEEPETPKCSTPVVTYVDGKLSLSCETEEAEFITKVMSDDITTYYDAEIEFSATYNIEVYATKSGYDNSDTINVALVWIENGEVNDENVIINIEATPVLIQGNGGTLNISGVTNGTEITVYTVSDTEVARTVATESTTTINTGLQSGTIAIVKIGNKSVKIKI